MHAFVEEYLELCEKHGLFLIQDAYRDTYPVPIAEKPGRWSELKRRLENAAETQRQA